MKLISIVLFIILPLNLWSQKDTVFIRKNINYYPDKIEYKTDTIIFETPNARNILIGDAIMTETYNQQVAKGYGLFFEKIEVSECGGSEYPKPNKIIEHKKENGKWIIRTKVYSNCCQDFLTDIKVENDETLNLKFYNYGMYCSCECPFEVTYTIRLMNFDDLKKITSIIINDDYSTLIKVE